MGCCSALMASLFASRRTATYGTASVLLALGMVVLVVPDALPGLTVPGHGSMPVMRSQDYPGPLPSRPPW